MKTALIFLLSLGIALLGLSVTSFAVPIAGDPALAKVILDKPLSTNGYGFTSHAGQQQLFEDFALSKAAEINRITWYGLFSDGTVANNQSTGSFDVSIFASNSDPNYVEKALKGTRIPEGIEVRGLPDKDAIFQATSTGVLGVGTSQSDALQGGDIKEWTMDVPTFSLASDEYFISIRASLSEPGFFLWNHSTPDSDGYSILGTISNSPTFNVSDEQYDTQAFSLDWVASASPHNVPDNGPGIAALLTVLGLLVASSRVRHGVV